MLKGDHTVSVNKQVVHEFLRTLLPPVGYMELGLLKREQAGFQVRVTNTG